MAPNVSTTSAATQAIRSPSLAPHPDYWIRGADFHLLLGHTLYKVHSHFFTRESRYWKNKLTGPTSPGDEPLLLGTSSTNALVLDERPVDFDCLLWVFYNTKFGDYSTASLKNWITILRYASKWEFPQVKELATRYIQNHEMDVVERIVLYQENKLPDRHLFPLYMQIAEREQFLTLEESKAIGYETLVLIHQARERLRAPSPMNNSMLSPIRTDLKPTDVIDIVASAFSIELASVTPISGNPHIPTPVSSHLPLEGNPMGIGPIHPPRREKETRSPIINDGEWEDLGLDLEKGLSEDWDLEAGSNLDPPKSAWEDEWDDSSVPGSFSF